MAALPADGRQAQTFASHHQLWAGFFQTGIFMATASFITTTAYRVICR